ncbi:MAG TPA: hypothetical protein VHK28_02040, partial [Candidatus Limnocylindria bacterium]|nr:hypothetical protein [Candidatus Limnocylindria bacterium]
MSERDELEARRRAERFERYLDALLDGGRPSPEDVADRDEAEMARLAAELSAASDPQAAPDPAFLEQVRARMRQADQGIRSVQTPLPVRPRPQAGAGGPATGSVRISRRQLLAGGVVGAAGLAAGALGASVLRQPEDGPLLWDDGSDLVAGEGEWREVAS